MKHNIRMIIPVFALLILVIIIKETFSIYSTTAYGTVQTNSAAWIVKIENTNITYGTAFQVSSSNITIDNTNSYADTNLIAPGTTGTIDLVLDATGTDVAVDYVITIGNAIGYYGPSLDFPLTSPIDGIVYLDMSSAITVTPATGYSLTGTINQNDSSMQETIVLDFAWTKTNSDQANTLDMAAKGRTIFIPITVTVTQHINSN